MFDFPEKIYYIMYVQFCQSLEVPIEFDQQNKTFYFIILSSEIENFIVFFFIQEFSLLFFIVCYFINNIAFLYFVNILHFFPLNTNI